VSKTSESTSTVPISSGGGGGRFRRRATLNLATVVAATFAGARRADALNWWLPPNYAKHGVEMDRLFTLVFVITVAVMVGVFAVMIYFLWKYRYNPARKKAHFTHGNTRLEMIWTILPAIILAVIALYSKGVWDRYRHGDPAEQGKPARLLVIGQQFQWNVIYAGADGKLGKYLVYPKPSDRLWPKGPDGGPFTFTFGKYEDTKGPADMPYEDAMKAINAYIDQENPLGKVFDDPAGKDDNFENQPGRPIYLPKGRPVEVQLSSKDVIHDFFLPNFRVKLDAVPGLRGVLNFVPTTTSKEIEARPENRRTFTNLDEINKFMDDPMHKDWVLTIDETSQPKAPKAKAPGAARDPRAQQWTYQDASGEVFVRDGQPLTPPRVENLKKIGVKEVTLHKSGGFDLVCEELCGQGHYKMAGLVIVVTPEEYAEQFETAPESADAGEADAKTAVSRK